LAVADRIPATLSQFHFNIQSSASGYAANVDPKRLTESAGVNLLVKFNTSYQLQDLRNNFPFL
jgi:hypothetical protein